MASVAIHASASIKWQRTAVDCFKHGLKRLGIDAEVTDNRYRISDHAICLGTTLWGAVEATGSYLLIDRASVGDPDYVSLVWNGHGRRGDHKVPQGIDDTRWCSLGFGALPWRDDGEKDVLCGQTETWSPNYKDLDAWYSQVQATHFRRHPAGNNPTGLPEVHDWSDVRQSITLNSSVAVDTVLLGIPTVTMDAAAMAWDVTSHAPGEIVKPDRSAWLKWLAWTQWSWREIDRGDPIAHHFEGI